MTLAGSTTGRRFTLVALLALTMAVGTFIVPGSACSPPRSVRISGWSRGSGSAGHRITWSGLCWHRRSGGSQTDPKRSIVVTWAAALTLALFAASPTYVILLGAAMCTGVSQAWANSATNKVISGSYPR